MNNLLSFIHPILMWGLLGLYIYAAYLGIQARRLRSTKGEEKRKLPKEKFAIKHYQMGSILLGLIVFSSIGGIAVTYISAGKLFIGPHLIVGLVMTVLIAASATLAPFMQRGNDWSRYIHISINIVLLGFFIWQAFTGTQIVQGMLH